MKTIIPLIIKFLFIGLLFSSSMVFSQSELDFDRSHSLQISTSFSFYEDTSKAVSIDDILVNNIQFEALHSSSVNFGFSSSLFWLNLNIKNISQQKQKIFLRVYQRSYMKVFRIDANTDANFDTESKANSAQLLSHYNSDENINQALIQDRYLVIPIEINTGETAQFYIHHGSQHSTLLDFEILDQSSLINKNLMEHSLHFIFSGVLLTLILIGLFQYLAFKQISYLFYALQATAVLVCFTIVEKWDLQYFWPNHPNFHEVLNVQAIHLLIISTCLFCKSFLNTADLSLWLNRILSAIILVSFFCMTVMPIFSMTLATLAFPINYLLSTVTIIVCIVYALKQGASHVRFYLFGWLFLLLPNILIFISALGGNIPISLTAIEVTKIAYLVEALCFIFALYEQLRAINTQHRDLQDKNISIMQERVHDQVKLLEVEKDKNRYLAEAQSSLEAIASTSHDLNQPIHSLRLSLESLEMKYDISLLDGHIDNTLNFFEELNNNIVLHAKDKHATLRDTLNINELFQEIAQRVAVTVKDKAITLDVMPCSLHIYQSKVVVLRIIENLLSNAIRYTREGKILMGVRRRSHAIEIQIFDTGIGISSHNISELLKPFKQNDNGLGTPGFGMGLAIVKKLCNENNYTLKIVSTVNKGSLFSVTIPIES